MSQTQSIKPDTGRPPVPDAAMECEQTGHSKGLPSVKLQHPGPGQSKRGLQATLSQSFQPDTPDHPNDNLLHSVSASSMRSTGSGSEAQTNIQDASQPESAFARSAQPARTNQQLDQQQFIPSAASEGAEVPDNMLPEHSLAAQMSSEAPASSLQQPSHKAANIKMVESADAMVPEHSLAAQMSSQLPASSAQHQSELSAQPSLPAASDDMLPEHSLAAQMSNADQLLSLAEKEAVDMLPEHSLVAQMSIDEPQPDAGEEDSVASRTTQLPHVLTTIESGLSAHFSGGFTPPGVSPFSMAPFPLSRAGSEALPPQPTSPESRKRHRGKVEEPLLRALSRLRGQRGPSQHPQQQHTASGSISSVLSMYPGLERAISNWAQQAQHGPSQSAESASRALSQALYPGLERAISNWAQQAQHDKLPSPQSAQLSSRAVSQALFPGLERAISNWAWAEPTQHESASRAASGISQCPGLECSISDWPQQTQHDKLDGSHSNQQGSRAMSSMSEAFYPGLERAISNWAQQAQHAMPDKMQIAESLTKAMSGMSDLAPGLECAISSWAQHAQHDRMEGALSAARAMSGMSDLPPGLERAISNWAIQAQHVTPDMKQTDASPPRAMSGVSEGCYPGLERAISNWAQQIELHKLNLSGSDQSASRASSAAQHPGLEQAISNWAQQAQHEAVSALQCSASAANRSESGVADWPPGLERAISDWAQHAQHAAPGGTQPSGSASRATSLMSEGMYPGLEHAISDWAQQAKHVNLQTPQSASRVGSVMSDAYFPGLERAISNWAQHAQHVNLRSSEPAQTATRAGSVMSEAFYPGLERAISNWAQHAQHVKPDLLPSSHPPPRAMSEAISEACYPGLERAISNWAQRAQHIQHELPQLAKSAASASRASSSALDEIYPGLEQAISDWARDAHFDLPAPMAQALSSSLSSVSEGSSGQEEGVTCAEPTEEDQQLLKLAATILSRSSSLYPGLESSFMPPSSGPAGYSSSSPAPPTAQVIGKAILAAASAHDQASDMAGGPEGAAAQKLGEAVLSTAAVAAAAAAKADHTAAGREAAPVSRSPAPPASIAARSPLSKASTARSDDKGDPQHEAGAVGSPQPPSPAGAKQGGRVWHADKMLKAHSRDLGQRQQLVHAKLHQGHPPTKSAEVASGKSLMDLKAEPAVADTDGFTKQAAAGSPSIKGGQRGLREAVSPTRDRMAQALRRRV